MPSDGLGLLNVDRTENLSPNQPQRLSRSPHPYQRNRDTVLQDASPFTTQGQDLPFAQRSKSTRPPDNQGAEATYFDNDHRNRRRPSSSPSESGTEADDEKEIALLGLPPPPTRLRKGYIGLNGSGNASPLLTPSYLDEEARRSSLRPLTQRLKNLQGERRTEDDIVKTREKFVRRRRAELIRRVTETILLGAIGLITFNNDIESVIRPCPLRDQDYTTLIRESLPQISRGTLVYMAVVLSLYVLYPVRIIYNNHALSVCKKRSPFYIHIPAAFEPAPLLYPILIPTLVASTLVSTDTGVLLPNLVLSIASIPSKIIPLNAESPWYSSPQWILAIFPVIFSRQHSTNMTGQRKESGLIGPGNVDNEELLTVLYPLHQAMLPAIEYLTTTSLLPAELQLLSIAMINLLLNATSPPAIILRALLWTGGLSLFILCSNVLSWVVALARVPSWRFRKSKSARNPDGNVLLCALDDFSSGYLSKWGIKSAIVDGSEDSDNEILVKPRDSVAGRSHRHMSSGDTRRVDRNEATTLQPLPNAPVMGSLHPQSVDPLTANGTVKDSLPGPMYKRQRGATLPLYTESSQEMLTRGYSEHRRKPQHSAPKLFSPRRLSKAQAVVLKWASALYTYAIVTCLITFVIRKEVTHNAISGQEPVGWALGYLFGGIPAFRDIRIKWNLEKWIAIPPSEAAYQMGEIHGISEWRGGMSQANIRLLICGYCIAIISAGLAVVFQLGAVAEVDTRRKVFHGMMVAMFLPTIFVDPTFVSLAFVLILAVFLLLDLLRASQLPPLSKPLTYFLAPYVDGRDHRGPVIVSHIFLLIGCAIPLWLSMAAMKQTGQGPWEGWEVEQREVSMISGVVCVGMGDAAASLIGRRYGRRRWCWSGGKSLEGSLAFAVAVVLGLSCARLWLLIGGWAGDNGDAWITTLGKATIAGTGASLTEAVLTGGNDNVIVPVILWLLVRNLRI